MKKIYILIILTGLILAVFFVSSYIKQPSDKINQKILINPCDNISEIECFAKLHNCIEADSLKEFMDKKGIKIGIKGWPEEWTNEIKSPIQNNFPNAKIFLTKQPVGGGDYGVFPLIKLNKIYCELTDENLKIVFSPIKNKEDALRYYLFVKKDLSSAWGQNIIYILNEEDYKDINIQYHIGDCGKDYKEKLQNKITEIKEVEDGYLITFVAFNYIYKTEFFESKVKIKFDGTIEEISKKTLLDCGPGAVF